MTLISGTGHLYMTAEMERTKKGIDIYSFPFMTFATKVRPAIVISPNSFNPNGQDALFMTDYGQITERQS